jgi:hypothetical protein
MEQQLKGNAFQPHNTARAPQFKGGGVEFVVLETDDFAGHPGNTRFSAPYYSFARFAQSVESDWSDWSVGAVNHRLQSDVTVVSRFARTCGFTESSAKLQPPSIAIRTLAAQDRRHAGTPGNPAVEERSMKNNLFKLAVTLSLALLFLASSARARWWGWSNSSRSCVLWPRCAPTQGNRPR